MPPKRQIDEFGYEVRGVVKDVTATDADAIQQRQEQRRQQIIAQQKDKKVKNTSLSRDNVAVVSQVPVQARDQAIAILKEQRKQQKAQQTAKVVYSQFEVHNTQPAVLMAGPPPGGNLPDPNYLANMPDPLAGQPERDWPPRRSRRRYGQFTGAYRPPYPPVFRKFGNGDIRQKLIGMRDTGMSWKGYDKEIIGSNRGGPLIPPTATLGTRGCPSVLNHVPALAPGPHHWCLEG